MGALLPRFRIGVAALVPILFWLGPTLPKAGDAVRVPAGVAAPADARGFFSGVDFADADAGRAAAPGGRIILLF